MSSTKLIAIAAAAFLSAACSETPTSPAADTEVRYGHESNNQATLRGMQGGREITGNAIINYVAGIEGWRSTVTLNGDLAPGTYTFYAISPTGALRFVCSFTVDGTGGRQGCSSDTDLAGFATAQVRDASGNIVASGTFDRRGGNREK